MRNNTSRLFVFLLGVAWLWGCCGAAHAVTPMVAEGDYHSIGLSADGTVYGWGSDTRGQLGLGRDLLASVPQVVPGLNLGQGLGKSRVSTWNHNVTVKPDGSVLTWGSNDAGQLGDGTTTNRSSPVHVPGLTGVVAVAAGHYHTVALKSDGSVWVWGGNSGGQLGDGTTTNRSSPVQVPGLTGVVAVAAGHLHTVALKPDGSVWTWGDNSSGQLGDGTTTNRSSPAQVPGLTGVTAVSGGMATLALKSDGSVWAWGSNWNGEVGDGTTANRLSPAQVLTGVAAVVTEFCHSLAVKSDGSVWAWGYNRNGQLGDGTTTNRSSPVQVQGLSGVVAVAVGSYHSIATKSDGSVWAWGSNLYGVRGDGTAGAWGAETIRTSPVQVQGLSGVVAVAANESNNLALKSDGSVWVWGSNQYGQLGDDVTTNRSTPGHVPALTGVAMVAGGSGHTIAAKSDGSVWAWGYNIFGQLGDGTRSDKSSPVQVQGLTDVTTVAAGFGHTIAAKHDGSVWAWGNNASGQLGDGTTMNRSSPVQVQELTGVVAVAAGGSHSLAVKSDGSVWAWGANSSGQLGDGTTTDRTSPVQVPGLAGVIAVAAGLSYNFALKSDGSVWVWGMWMGVEQVPGLTGVIAVAANGGALKSDGSVWEWIGRGIPPGQVAGLSGVMAMSVGGTRAIKSDGSVAAWGSNIYGQIGDGTLTQRQSPVLVVNTSVDGFLNLITGTTVNVPPELNSPFFVSSTGGITDTSATVGTTTKFNAADAGKQGAVYVTAMVPSGSLGTALAMRGEYASRTMALAAPAANSFVMMQLTPSGWQPVVDGQLIPYASGVLGDQLAAQAILNGTDTTNLKGAEFCVGYGTSAAEMTSAGRMRAVATIPDPNATSTGTVSCIVGSTSSTTATDTTITAAAKTNQTVSFGNAPTIVIGGTGTVSATASSGLPVTYSSTTASVCTVSGNAVTGISAGACIIAADQAGDASYNAATQVMQSITIGKASQTVSFGTAPTIVVGGTGTVSATATSGLPVSYSSTTASVCTVSGSTVTGIAAGTCTIAADQSGDASYNAATQVTQNITVGKISQTISFGPAPTIVVGGTGTVSAAASSGLAVSFSPNLIATCAAIGCPAPPPPNCMVSGNTVTGLIAGTCSIIAYQAGNDIYSSAMMTQTFIIGMASQLPISDTRVFSYAEANYPSLFTVPATAGQYLQYNYRYYPASDNYLAIDSSGVISILGTATGGALTPVGPVESFRSYITAWEAVQ